jgi:hypothetical protein
VPKQKKLMSVPVRGSTRGGAIRLYQPTFGVLGLSEGIENALSLRLLRGGIAVWSAYCADNLERIRLPPGLRELQIGVDLDASGRGEAALIALVSRLRKWPKPPRLIAIRPDLTGLGDLNDELRGRPR